MSPGLRRIAEEMGGIKGLATGPDGSFFISYPRAVLRVARDGTFTPLLNPVVAPDCDKHPPSIQDAPSLRGLVGGCARSGLRRCHGMPLCDQDYVRRKGWLRS